MTELNLPHGIRHSSRDVILPEGMAEEQWLDYGRFLRAAQSATVFWESRWLQYGRRNFGEESIKRAAEQLEIEFADLKAMDALNRLEVRSPGLSAEHHFVLSRASAKLDKTGLEMWARMAERNDLSAAELQLSIRKGVVTRISRPGSGSSAAGIASFQGLQKQWELLRRQIDPVLSEWTQEDAAAALAALSGLVAFAEDLRARFFGGGNDEMSAG